MSELLHMLTQQISTYSLGDYASIIGLVVTLFGFGLTLRNVSISRKAAQSAEAVALNVQADLQKTNTIAEFAQALAVMEEIKRLHRVQAFDHLPDRYSSLRKSLITIRSENPILSSEDQQAVQRAITYFAGLEREIDGSIGKEKKNFDIAKTNSAVSKQIDNLQEVLVRIKQLLGSSNE